jgi:hypothetical protein
MPRRQPDRLRRRNRPALQLRAHPNPRFGLGTAWSPFDGPIVGMKDAGDVPAIRRSTVMVPVPVPAYVHDLRHRPVVPVLVLP